MDKLKNFFQQKKAKAKFAMMSGGTKLSDASSSRPVISHQPVHSSYGRAEPTQDAKLAGEAAMARLALKNNPRVPTASSTYMRLKGQIEDEVKREAKETSAISSSSNGPQEVLKSGPKILEVSGIYFTCPLIGPETASWNEMKEKIDKFLEEQLMNQEAAMAAALMIHSLNKDGEIKQKSIEIITKYLENIITNPSEPKFCRIRMQNKALQEKVLVTRGALEYLKGVGFEEKEEDTENGPEQFLVLREDCRDSTLMKEKLDILLLAEPIVPVLDRGVRVYFPSANASRFGELPPEFYTISKEELKKEQQVRQEAVEKLGMLRTKAMRDRDAIHELRRYRCALIRFRFPDQTLLQGTFWSSEKASDLFEFVQENIEPSWAPFSLSFRSPQGTNTQLLEETPGTLAEHGLCPASLVNVVFDSDLMEQCKTEQIPPPRLKSATLELIQPL